MRSCDQVYDDGYSGTITMECMNGGLRAWHSCYRSEVDIVAVVAITVAVMLVLGALFAAAVIALSRRRETKVVVPLTTLVAQAEVQTDPQVSVELTCGQQQALDIVFCLDSSASVGQEGFAQEVEFLGQVAHTLDMPRVRMGVVQFHHSAQVVSPLESTREALLARLGTMSYESGETRLEAPLRQAGVLFHHQGRQRDAARRAIVVITDGEVADPTQAEDTARGLREQGILIVVMQIGGGVKRPLAAKLASDPCDQHCLVLRGCQDLRHAASDMLRRLLRVSLWAKRAKINMDTRWLERLCFKEVQNLDSMDGAPLILPGWQEKTEDCWLWEPTRCPSMRAVGDLPWDPKIGDESLSCSLSRCGTEAAEVQTEPQLVVELERSAQCPVDLVFCLESSVSVGEQEFLRAAEVVRCVAQEAEMPTVRIGVLRFNHGVLEVCRLTGDPEVLQQRVRAARYEAGETRLAPPLRQASAMLMTPHPMRKQAIVLLLGGNLVDAEAAKAEAKALKDMGVIVFVVQVGSEVLNNGTLMEIASYPHENNFLRVRDDLQVLSGEIMASIVEVSLTVRRARCVVDVATYTQVNDVGDVDGQELSVPDPMSVKAICRGRTAQYDPRRDRKPTRVVQSEDVVLQDPTQQLNAGTQTEALIHASFGVFRQLPLDLVVCIDSSASFGRVVDAQAVTASGLALEFVEQLLSAVQVPEVNLALVRMGSSAEEVVPLTTDLADFRARLRELSCEDGETRLAPALRAAHRVLERRQFDTRRSTWAAPLQAAAAVLVLTDGAQTDWLEAQGAAEVLRNDSAQLLFVKVGGLAAEPQPPLEALAFATALAPKASEVAGASRGGAPLAIGRGVFEATGMSPAACRALVPEVLAQVLQVSRVMRRAHVALPMRGYREVADVAGLCDEGGVEVAMRPDVPLLDPTPVRWEPPLAM